MCPSQKSATEERSEQTRSFVPTVKAATRRKYSPEEKIRIVPEGFRREETVNDLCRREGIKLILAAPHRPQTKPNLLHTPDLSGPHVSQFCWSPTLPA